ncbi:hypothetical protein CAOG_010078 [Capsaspora owczarzaki ATCC 30864]|uniref:Uncharacterized protein n=1 Tax=Capsaspora owczarzaki (strain ATCC 30864) TaxID=595528 RepID=A0A0D2UQ46_CAPO3|nr:hypothetical protein CAOG_010078 [Capsaspora owczarzaki ATCC 30864]
MRGRPTMSCSASASTTWPCARAVSIGDSDLSSVASIRSSGGCCASRAAVSSSKASVARPSLAARWSGVRPTSSRESSGTRCRLSSSRAVASSPTAAHQCSGCQPRKSGSRASNGSLDSSSWAACARPYWMLLMSSDAP